MDLYSLFFCCKPKEEQVKSIKLIEVEVPASVDVKKDSIPEGETSTQLVKKLSVENKPSETLPKQSSLKDTHEEIKVIKPNDDKPKIIAIECAPAIQKIEVTNISQLSTDSLLLQKRVNVHLIITEKYPGLFTNQQSPFKINEFGLEGTAKTTQTNFIFFGLDESKSTDFLYDVVMSLGAEGHNPTELFYILYENNSKNYILKSLTKEFFFSNVIVPYQQIVLEDHQKNYFKIGKIILSIYPRFSEESIELIIKKGETISTKQRITFTKGKFPVSIGRSNCSVNLSCESLSKSHASIDYDIAHRRFFFIDNASTNGSQMLLNKGKNLKLTGEQVFNINDRLFTIKENFK